MSKYCREYVRKYYPEAKCYPYGLKSFVIASGNKELGHISTKSPEDAWLKAYEVVRSNHE